MINNDEKNDNQIIPNSNSSTLNPEDRKKRTQDLFAKLSLLQNEETDSNIDPRSLRGNQNSIENQDSKNTTDQVLQPKKEQLELSENIRFYPVSPPQAQQVIGIIYDVKISGLEYSNKILQEKLSKTSDPREREMLDKFIKQNQLSINQANVDKFNQELNKQLQAIIEQSQIMDFIEQSEKYQKQRKAESSFALQTSSENNSQLGGILGDMRISFQTVSGENNSSVLVIDQDVNNQMAVEYIEQQISQPQTQLQSQSQIQSQSQSQSQFQSQSQSQGGRWVNAVSSNNGNQTSITTNQSSISNKPVLGPHTAALAARNQSGVVLTTQVASKAR